MTHPARPRRRSLLIGAAAAAATSIAGSQPRVRRVGIAYNSDPEGARRYQDALVQGMAEQGLRVERDYAIEARYAGGRNDRYPSLMDELLHAGVDVIVAGPNTAVAAARAATRRIPIVMAGTSDPEATGLVASFARPGANVTGVAMHTVGLVAKRLELCRALLPAATHVGYLYDPTASGAKVVMPRVQETFGALAFEAVLAGASSADELDGALTGLRARRPDALVVSPAIALWTQRQRIVDFCTRQRLPGVFPYREYVDAGGLASYAASLLDAFRLAGTCVARILAGATPSTLPVEQPTRFELVVNLRAAQAIGVTVPSSVLARADDVIR